jgi:hypothetical protein
MMFRGLLLAHQLHARRLQVSAIFMLLLLAACIPDYATPTVPGDVVAPEGARLNSDFPGVVYGVEAMQDGYMLNDDRVCLAMYGDAFWERGEVWDSPDDLPRFEIQLNDQSVTNLQLALIPPIIQIGDGRGGTAGATPSGYTYCFPTADIPIGRYIVDVIATPRSGLVRQFTWTLIVP